MINLDYFITFCSLLLFYTDKILCDSQKNGTYLPYKSSTPEFTHLVGHFQDKLIWPTTLYFYILY